MSENSPSLMSPDWIERVISQNPCQDIGNGNFRTVPHRIGFPHLFTAQAPLDDGGKSKFSVVHIFQSNAGVDVLKAAAMAVGAEKWGDKFAEYATAASFRNPFQDQALKAKYEGFTAGLISITSSGERRPALVDQREAPIVDPTKVYPGAWAICVIRPFAFETKNKQGSVLKRGLGFGLQSVMIVADDTEFGGTGVDVRTAFAGVKIDAAVNPSAAFGTDGHTAGAEAPARALL